MIKRNTYQPPPRFCRDCGHGHHITTAHLNQQGEPVLLNCDITGKAHLLSERSCKNFLPKFGYFSAL